MRVGDSHSRFRDLVSGVPQGTILGPLLFVIYVNDLPCSLYYAIPYMFADDTKCATYVSQLITALLGILYSQICSVYLPGAQLGIYYLMNLSLSICVFGQNVLIVFTATI